MSGNSAKEALRQIRVLYALGPVGGLSDAELVERFLARGADGEDAFAALVERHGPMVLRVCRRMLPGSADAEDAFQAVFLILARKAGSIRRLDVLKSWLYGVTVRTAKEARRRSARRRARETLAMDQPEAGQYTADQQSAELLALLDEELDRLPARFREALMLCELEGVSRKEAAGQLGIAQGTLSSRLSRGRALLRDRLTRRGVTLGAAPFLPPLPESSGAALSDSLADTTVRHALAFAAGGSVPAPAISLAEGVLAMMAMAKLKLTLVAAFALVAATSLAWAVGPDGGAEPPAEKPLASAEAKAKGGATEAGSKSAEVRGVVVDEAGRPVGGAEVLVDAFSRNEVRGTTVADGSFTIRTRRRRLDGTKLLARSSDRRSVGTFSYNYLLATPAAKIQPARIVLRPGREVVVRVADKNQAPVPGAVVEAAGDYAPVDHGATGPDGTATLILPPDARIEWIVALKPGQGADYAEFGAFDPQQRSVRGVEAGELPRSVALTLEAGRTARIRAVDGAGKSLAGISFYLWLLHREGRQSQVNFASRIFNATTDREGIATFDWLPPSKHLLQIFPATDGYAHHRVVVDEGETGTVVANMTRTETIRGRVTRPDGAPAQGIEVRAFGSGKGIDHGQSRARTAADGSYEMDVNAGEAYAVFVDDKDWAAPARLDVVVLEGKPIGRVDFALRRGTVIRGRVTIGPGGIPASEQYILFIESAGQAPPEVRVPGDRTSREVRRQLEAHTDEQGRYSIRVGPGTYTVLGPPRTGNEKITVKDEIELVRDYQMPRPEKGPISGQVIAGPEGRGVAGASVEFQPAGERGGIPFTVKADARGRFYTERPLDRTFVCAKSPDGSLGALVQLGPLEPEVTLRLEPTATATGVLLDDRGKPAASTRLDWGRRIYLGEEQKLSTLAFAPKVVTDAEGRFTLPALVVGQEYDISLLKDNVYQPAGVARPEAPGVLDLGMLRAGSYRPQRPGDDGEVGAFRKDAPGAGADAPPILAATLTGMPLSLADFRGRYVLLDFWATWCGPCIAEIPQLQAVFDAFGKDERFAMLSLSVDDDIKEPKAFQEKRKLPWDQAFLGHGLHGPTLGSFGIRAIPALVLVGPDGKIVARGMRGDAIMKEVARALGKSPAPPVGR